MSATTDQIIPNYTYSPIAQPRAFEGASTSYKNGLKGLLIGEPDQLAVRELRFLQLRSEHAVRNNGYARIAKNKWVTNANSIKVRWKDENGKKHSVMQELYDEWWENPNLDGFGDYNVTQGISNSSIFLDGASYIRKVIQRTGNSNVVPLKLQLIPAIQHAVNYNVQSTPFDPNEISRYGMTFVKGIPTKYHFYKSILERTMEEMATGVITEVPSSEIIHTFFRDSPGQWLGIPILAPVLLSLYSLDELLDATINKQKASQAIAMVVENANNAANQLAIGAPIYRKDNEIGQDRLIMQSRDASVQYTNKGETVKWFQGGDIGVNFLPLVTLELRKIASVCDLMLHELNGDTASLNFSALMGLSILSRNRLEYLHNFLFIPLRERPIAKTFKELAVLYRPEVANAKPYFDMPRWRGLDDLKDTQADLLAVQNGLETYESVLNERGLATEDIIADRETITELETFGIFLNSAGGAKQMANAKDTGIAPNTVGV
jgi:capsid protein